MRRVMPDTQRKEVIAACAAARQCFHARRAARCASYADAYDGCLCSERGGSACMQSAPPAHRRSLSPARGVCRDAMRGSAAVRCAHYLRAIILASAALEAIYAPFTPCAPRYADDASPQRGVARTRGLTRSSRRRYVVAFLILRPQHFSRRGHSANTPADAAAAPMPS